LANENNERGCTLASVVFSEIQEFARRPVQEQARLRAQLEAVVAVTTAELRAANRVVLDAADGAAIVVLGDPKAALQLAGRALRRNGGRAPPVRRVNHGAVQVAAGGRDGDGMIRRRHRGGGERCRVCLALAPALMSRSFRDAMADASPGLESGLFPAGFLPMQGCDPRAVSARTGGWPSGGGHASSRSPLRQ